MTPRYLFLVFHTSLPVPALGTFVVTLKNPYLLPDLPLLIVFFFVRLANIKNNR